MRVAIVHDYLFQFGGGEKVVEKWLKMYPQADLWTSFFVQEKFTSSPEITTAFQQNRLKTTWLQKLFGTRQKGLISKPPFLGKYFKHFFWLYPLVMSFVKIKNYDLVIISSTYCAKYVKLENCSKVIHYCNSPTRFLHGLVTETDHKTITPIFRIFLPLIKFVLKSLDLRAVRYLNQKGVFWISNSQNIQNLVSEVYKTKSVVLYPPVEISKFLQLPKNINTQEPYYYYFGRISFHKRIDLAILACLELGRKLVITGSSAYQAEMDKLKKIVIDYEKLHPQLQGLIIFTGRSSDQERNELLAGCRAFLFPGKEDFGIAPIEALASGTPVIAYKAGGALEYIKQNQNGIFFEEQTVASMKQAILDFENKNNWNEEVIRDSAKPFNEDYFEEKFKSIVANL